MKLADEHLFKNKNNKSQNEFKNKNQDELIAHTAIFDLISGKEVEEGFRPVKIKSKDWVTVIVEMNGKFLMTRQLRHGLNKEFEEFPCGMVEDSEHPFETAIRELKEETGLDVETFNMKYLGKYAANPAFMTNYMHYFHIVPKRFKETEKHLDEHEHVESYWKDKNEAFETFVNSDGSSIMGCGWMLLIKEGIISEWN